MMGPVGADADRVRERYLALVDELVGVDGVTPPPGGSGFGRGSLRYQGKIFAMLVRGRLVVKLPEARVAEFITSGEGAAFDAHKGTPMREWLSLDPESAVDWLSLASEALDFARAAAAPSRSRR
jgi:TfoX/Sxy family transcriptional regulator of competence genes